MSYEIQTQLEQWQRRVGASRATEPGWESGAASFLAYRMVGPYLSTVLNYYERGQHHAGRHGKIWSLFGNEDNLKQVALETLFSVISGGIEPCQFNKLASAIGNKAEYVLWLSHPNMKGMHVQGLKLASHSDLGMNSVMARLKDKHFIKAQEGYVALDRLEKCALGAFFLEAIAASTGLIEIVVRKDGGRRSFRTVEKTELFWTFLQRWKHNLMLFRYAHMPMTVPPRPYTQREDGGYFSIETAWLRGSWENYPTAVAKLDPSVMGALNKLQATPMFIDKEQLEIIRWAWDTGHEVGSVPNRFKIEPITYREAYVKCGNSAAAWSMVWKQKADERKNGQRGKIINMFIAAERLKDHDRLYWVWSADGRGRFYPRSAQLNYAGDDSVRSLFKFDKGAPIKGNEKEFAWAVGEALGLPADRTEREHWLMLGDMAQRIAENPYETMSLWADVKKPWRYLSLCREWGKYCADPGHLTHLPFQLDQTTSGYGHVACLTRDARLAEWTNVIGDEPQDLYMRLAGSVHELAHWTYETMMDGDHNKTLLKWWLNHWPKRDLFKPAIMPIIYGRRYFSMQPEIAELLIAQFGHAQTENLQATALAGVLSRLILSGVRHCIPNVLDLFQWLSRVATTLARKGIRAYWYTPNGLRIESYHFNTTKKLMKLNLSGRKVDIQLRDKDPDDDTLKVKTSHLAADYIQSMDAAFLQKFVHSWEHEIVTVHDCFATTLDKVQELRTSLNESFHQFYQRDYLHEHYMLMVNEVDPAMPPPPNRGTLNADMIGENEFLFT